MINIDSSWTIDALDSNLGPQDGRRWRFHQAIAAAQETHILGL